MNARIALVSAMLTGCAMPVIVPVHTVSKARFSPQDRRSVWGRTLESFQNTNTLIAYSDPVGGILRSEMQPSQAPCSGSYWVRTDNREEKPTPMCDGLAHIQFTICDEGLAILRTNRTVRGSVSGYNALVTDRDLERLQTRQDALLKWIATGAGEAPDLADAPPLEHEGK